MANGTIDRSVLVNDEPNDDTKQLAPGEEALDGDGQPFPTVWRAARAPLITDVRPAGHWWLDTAAAPKAMYWTSGSGVWVKLVLPTEIYIPPPTLVEQYPEFIDTFVNGLQAGMGWTIAALSGTYAQIAPPTGKGGRNGVIGVINVTTGTSTTGRVGAILGANLLRFTAGSKYSVWCRFLALDLSLVTDEYIFRMGFIDSNLAAESVDGAYFEYSRAASVNWRCKTASNSTRTTVTTTTAVQNANWIDLKIVVDGTAGTATFYVDDVVVATISTNVPTVAGRETSIGFVIHKTVGGNSRGIALDRIYFKLEAA